MLFYSAIFRKSGSFTYMFWCVRVCVVYVAFCVEISIISVIWYSGCSCSMILLGLCSYPRKRPWRPIGLWDIKNPTLSRQSAQKAVRLLAPSTGSDLLRRNINFFLLVLISATGWETPRVLYGMKDYVNWIFIHFTGSLTRDHPADNIEPYSLHYWATQRVCVCVLIVTNNWCLMLWWVPCLDHVIFKEGGCYDWCL
jgi:hypothetical protein